MTQSTETQPGRGDRFKIAIRVLKWASIGIFSLAIAPVFCSLILKRKGKNILINLSDGKTLLIHQKMTGHLLYGSFDFAQDRSAILFYDE